MTSLVSRFFGKTSTASRKRVPAAAAAAAAPAYENKLKILENKFVDLNNFIDKNNERLYGKEGLEKSKSDIENLEKKFRDQVTEKKHEIEFDVSELKKNKKNLSKKNQEKLWILELDIYQFNINNGYPAQHPDQHFPHVGHLGPTLEDIDRLGGGKKRFTPFRIENAKCNVAFSLKSAHEKGRLNEKKCKKRKTRKLRSI